MQGPRPAALAKHLKASLSKILNTCALAFNHGIQYAWVDTCCIDKRNPAQLAEAINSMWAWYRQATVCYVFLEDLPPGGKADLARDLGSCKWFSRGWTLQELLAPRRVEFFDREWRYRGSKRALADLLNMITKIPVPLLRSETDVGAYPVAARMSWAAQRQTTKVEDMAYCLLGIFDVNMPLNYGEGKKAFTRLQTAILQSTVDMTIFVWTDDRKPCPLYAGILAESPRQFAGCHDVKNTVGDSASHDFTITTRGIQTDIIQVHNSRHHDGEWKVAMMTFCHIGHSAVAIGLRRIGAGLCLRAHPEMLISLGDITASNPLGFFAQQPESVTLATKLPSPYPFLPSSDPVIGSRWSGLRVDWGPITVNYSWHEPRTNWDAHDAIFFSCDSNSQGWGAYIVRGRLVSEPSEQQESAFLLACFNWNQEAPIVVFARLDDVSQVTRTMFELQLGQTQFKNDDKAKFLVMGVLKGGLQDRWIDTGMGPARYLSDVTTLGIQLRRERLPVCASSVLVIYITAKSSSDGSTISEQMGRTTLDEEVDMRLLQPVRALDWYP